MSRHCQVRDCLRPVEVTIQISARRRLEEKGPGGLPVTGYADVDVLCCSRCGGQILQLFEGPIAAEVVTRMVKRARILTPEDFTR